MKRIGIMMVMIGALTTMGLSVLMPSSTVQARCQGFDCVENQIDRNLQVNTGNNNTVESLAETITNTIIYFVGAAAIIMLIYGGIIYALSAGDSTKAKKAKDTILYAIIGLAIAVLAYAIATFVIDAIVL